MDKIYFTVNGEHYSLSGSEVSPLTSLYDYLHNYLQLFGTKAMCHEGGCGACIVSVTRTHPVTKEKETIAVNSCVVHILSCHQWDITTVEGVGNRKDGYHAIQTRLAAFNGTQCGYCTPGWVLTMYSLYQSFNTKLSVQEVEKSFGGNLCRCTGYRPILDAFKSFANDFDPELKDKLQDVEDLHDVKCLKKCEKRCSVVDEDWCVLHNKREQLMEVGGPKSRWYKAFTIPDVFKVLTKEGLDSYKLISGNTGVGVFNPYWSRPPRVFLDISSIEAIKDYYVDVNLVIGAGVTLTEFMDICKTIGKRDDFNYLKGFYDHLDLVAHTPVRNIGTIGGNLALKHENIQFPSDIYLLLELIQAMVTLVSNDLKETTLSMQDFMKTDLKNKIITHTKLPPVSSRCVTRSYKIMPRAQNALAIVNAGFFFKLNRDNKVEEARIVYGAISPTFVRARETENALVGQDLTNEKTLQIGLRSLNEELIPADNPTSMSPLCRKNIALGLFYRAILSLNPSETLNSRYTSGASAIYREVSRGTQTFDTDKTLWPLNKPVPKLEALAQCSGEVAYACDVVPSRKEVHVAFVLSTICLGEIDHIDASEALKTPGVVGFLTAKDIPGENSYIPSNAPWYEFQVELLATKKISYYGQPIALIAANTQTLAISAADLVKVTYRKSEVKPVLSIKEALVAPDRDERLREDANIQPKDKGDDTTHVINGSYYIPSQYHFTMETQSCHVSYNEDILVVRSATQWPDLVHIAVGKMLGIDQNRVRVVVNRIGGGYGAKGSQSSLAACACALVTRVLQRPAAIVLPLTHNMRVYGKRMQCRADYE
ncbi:hypothetical protein evm_012521, partial [Chilo suppressalis]